MSPASPCPHRTPTDRQPRRNRRSPNEKLFYPPRIYPPPCVYHETNSSSASRLRSHPRRAGRRLHDRAADERHDRPDHRRRGERDGNREHDLDHRRGSDLPGGTSGGAGHWAASTPPLSCSIRSTGSNRGTGRCATQIAGAGFVVVAPEWQTYGQRAGDDEVESVIRSAVGFLQNRSDVDGARLGLTGFCAGGRYTMLFLPQMSEFGAGVAWYGFPYNGGFANGTTPAEAVADLESPMLMIHGSRDQASNITDIYNYTRQLDAADRYAPVQGLPGQASRVHDPERHPRPGRRGPGRLLADDHVLQADPGVTPAERRPDGSRPSRPIIRPSTEGAGRAGCFCVASGSGAIGQTSGAGPRTGKGSGSPSRAARGSAPEDVGNRGVVFEKRLGRGPAIGSDPGPGDEATCGPRA